MHAYSSNYLVLVYTGPIVICKQAQQRNRPQRSAEKVAAPPHGEQISMYFPRTILYCEFKTTFLLDMRRPTYRASVTTATRQKLNLVPRF